MQSDHTILCAYNMTDGQAALSEAEIIHELKDESAAWVNLNAEHENTAAWLQKNVAYLNPLVIQALLADETRPRCEFFDQGVMLILRGVNLNQGAEPEDMVSLRLWADPHRVITLHKRPLKALKQLEADYQAHHAPSEASTFITRIIGYLLDVMEPVLSEIDERIDDLEEELMQNPRSNLRHELAFIRRQALQLKRFISPQREAIAKLRNAPIDWIAVQERMHLQEHYDRITRFVESLDSQRERCQIVQDELATIMADKLNRNTYILSIVAAVFLPLGFITGLLGINVGGMPGADNTNAFAIVSVLCVLIIVVETILFKKLRWF